MIRYAFLIVLIGFLFLLGGCQEEDITDPTTPESPKTSPLVQQGLDTIRYWYYWADDIPTELPTENYANLSELLFAVEHPQDRFSGVFDLEYIKQIFQGTPEDFGFGGEAFDDFGSLILGYVYAESPAGKAGLTRGCKILTINEQVPQEYGNGLSSILAQPTLDFLIEFPDQTTKEVTLTKTNYKTNPILHHSVIQEDGKNIGYLVLNSFVGVENYELDAVFADFKSQNVTDLIIDVRYNGGGYLSTVNHLANLVFPARFQNYAFVRSRFNSARQAEYGENTVFYTLQRQASSLNISQLAVITTGNSASGSEVLVNNLRPYMTVKTIGSRTYGKPTFNRLYEIDNYGLYLTLGITGNVEGKAEYFEGIPADGLANDDQTKAFGDPEEASLKEALHYIKFNNFSEQTGKIEPKKYARKPFIF